MENLEDNTNIQAEQLHSIESQYLSSSFSMISHVNYSDSSPFTKAEHEDQQYQSAKQTNFDSEPLTMQQSPDPVKNHAKIEHTDEKHYKTPSTFKIESGPTLETENEYNSQAVSQAKKSNQSKKKSPTNFLEKNKRVRTRIELFSEFSEKKKTRDSNVVVRPSYASRQDTKPKQKQLNQRQSEWTKINQKNLLMSQTNTSNTGAKNQSKDFVVKHIEVSINNLLGRSSSSNALGGTFSKNRREKWYHQTNSSSITNLRSYQSLDVPVGKEDKEFPTTKGNQALKRQMNQSQVFPRSSSYLREDDLPEDFKGHQAKREIVHNVNNVVVQNLRLRNRSSLVFE